VTTRLTGRIASIAVAAVFIAAACGSGSSTTAPTSAASQGASGPNCVSGSITAAGSTALQPLVDAAGKAYTKVCTGATINVQGGGSGAGLTQVSQGAVQIGDSDVLAGSKLATPDAAALVDHVVARQGWVMIANSDVTGVTNLTTDQATKIWTGVITNWKDVGGPDLAIQLILRPASSGTRATFKKIVLGGADEAQGNTLTEDSNGAVTTAVSGTPGSTSVVGFAYYQANKGTLVAFQLDGVDASVANMVNNTYKLQAFGHMYTKGAPADLTKAFLDYMLSSDVQNTLIPSLFYAPAGQQ
jgi:phosphate transport system substrate-binding protein